MTLLDLLPLMKMGNYGKCENFHARLRGFPTFPWYIEFSQDGIRWKAPDWPIHSLLEDKNDWSYYSPEEKIEEIPIFITSTEENQQ